MKTIELQAGILKTLSHPKRLQIICLLGEQELSVGEMQEILGFSQSNLSQHLMNLRNAEVVNTRRSGKRVYYSLTHKNFAKVGDLVHQLLVGEQKVN